MITAIQLPQQFTPSGNPVRLALQSDNPNIVFFRTTFHLLNVATLQFTQIATNDFYPTPAEPTVTRFDCSAIIKDYLTSKYKPTNTHLATHPEHIVGLGCVSVEYVVNQTTGAIVTGSTYSNLFFAIVFSGNLDRVSFSSWNWTKYTMDNNANALFLTMKQPNRNIHLNYYSREYLYYFIPVVKSYLALQVEYFNVGSGSALNKTIYYGTDAVNTNAGIKRLNASPTSLFTLQELSSLSHYNVRLIQSNAAQTLATPMSAKYFYTYHNDVCQKPVLVHWTNKFGVYETSEFNMMDPTLNVVKDTMLLNPNAVVSGMQQDYTSDGNNVFHNAAERTLNLNSSTTIKLTTPPLSDNEMKYLAGILMAKKILIEFEDGVTGKSNFIPVTLDDNTYGLTPAKMRKENNVRTFSFKMSDNFSFDY